MWPKLLLEFLPHLTRLIPAADNYLSSRKESDKAYQAALTSLKDEVRSGFAKAAEEQSNLGREVKAHIAGSAQQASDLARMRSILDSAEVRIATIENRLAIILRLLWSVVFLLAVTIVIIAIHACR